VYYGDLKHTKVVYNQRIGNQTVTNIRLTLIMILQSTVCGEHGIHGLLVVKRVAEESKSGQGKLTLMRKTVEQHVPDFPRSNKTAKQELVLLVSITITKSITLRSKYLVPYIFPCNDFNHHVKH